MSLRSRINNAGIIVSLLLAGCAAGRDFDITRVHDLQSGVTSIADAERLFGKPVSISALPDGGKLLHWMYVTNTMCESHRTHLAVLFAPDGRMVHIVEASG